MYFEKFVFDHVASRADNSPRPHGKCFVVDIEAKLTRMDAPSLFGADIEELSFYAEMQTENRFRFKVCL